MWVVAFGQKRPMAMSIESGRTLTLTHQPDLQGSANRLVLDAGLSYSKKVIANNGLRK